MTSNGHELIDRLHASVTEISRDERIDRALALTAMKKRLEYESRRIDNLVRIGWVNDYLQPQTPTLMESWEDVMSTD
jgi:hypothetical protein